jgi:uncharacterized protein YfaP (DUF2135 family)
MAGCSDDRLTKVRVDASTRDAAVASDASPVDLDAAPDAAASLDATSLDVAEQGDAQPSDAAVSDAACVVGISTGQLTTNDSAHTFSGTGPASTSGVAVVTSSSGMSQTIPFATDTAGNWTFTVPLFCGSQTVDITFPMTCAASLEIAVMRGMCTVPDIQLTLTWDDLGLDFELHLIRRGGHINSQTDDCTWTTCISRSPDWGVIGDPTDNPHKDVDNTGHFGPENIYLDRPIESPYTVMVEHWGLGPPQSSGSVKIRLSDGTQSTVSIDQLSSHWVREIGTIDFTTHTITTSTVVWDCNQSWSAGCILPIP